MFYQPTDYTKSEEVAHADFVQLLLSVVLAKIQWYTPQAHAQAQAYTCAVILPNKRCIAQLALMARGYTVSMIGLQHRTVLAAEDRRIGAVIYRVTPLHERSVVRYFRSETYWVILQIRTDSKIGIVTYLEAVVQVEHRSYMIVILRILTIRQRFDTVYCFVQHACLQTLDKLIRCIFTCIRIELALCVLADYDVFTTPHIGITQRHIGIFHALPVTAVYGYAETRTDEHAEIAYE